MEATFIALLAVFVCALAIISARRTQAKKRGDGSVDGGGSYRDDESADGGGDGGGGD